MAGAHLQSADAWGQLCQVVALQCQLCQLTQVAQLGHHLLDLVAMQAELAQLTCNQSPMVYTSPQLAVCSQGGCDYMHMHTGTLT